MRVKWAPRASRDAREIWVYIADDSSHHADAWFERLLAKVELLADNPNIGPVQPGLKPELRSVKLGHYRVYYRAARGGVDVVRVLHASRDLKRQSFD